MGDEPTTSDVVLKNKVEPVEPAGAPRPNAFQVNPKRNRNPLLNRACPRNCARERLPREHD